MANILPVHGSFDLGHSYKSAIINFLAKINSATKP